MSTVPLSPPPGQSQRRRGMFWIMTGTKLIGTAIGFPMSRRAKASLGAAGVGALVHGASQWLAGKHAQGAARPPAGDTQEIKATRTPKK